MMNNVVLGFGSNKGKKLRFILDAIYELISASKFKIDKISKFYETRPYGDIEQDNFINCVVSFKTKLELKEVFKTVKSIEKKLGRKKSSVIWGPREIDIDILFFNDLIYSDDELTIPHKEILNRDFVIIPLKDIAREFIHPQLNIAIEDIDVSKIEKCIINQYITDLKHFAGEIIGRY